MGIPISIENLINKRIVESSRIEFKSDWNPEPVLHSICAFANDIDNMGGGYIVLGVEEKDGQPVFPIKGIDSSKIDGIMKDLRNKCHFIEPLYEPVVQPFQYQGSDVIVIWVAGGYGRPYKAPKSLTRDISYKKYYIRKYSSTVVASADEEKQLFYISSNIPFDDRPNLAANLSDLDIGIMRDYLNKVDSSLYRHSLNYTPLEIAKDLQIVSGPTEDLRPLNVGILMFSEQPEKYFRYARIEIVDIPDPTGTGMTESIFRGPIQRQLENALSYIKNYVIKSMTIKSDDKAESEVIYNYPFRAVEEILSNAVYHKSYQINEPITVRITGSEMEITSFPGFAPEITDEDIRNYNIRARSYRNRRIGEFLKELKLIEGRNTGFPNTYQALKENGSEMPIFRMDEQRNYLSVTIPIHRRFLNSRNLKELEYERRVLSALREKPLTLTELSKKLGYKSIPAKLSKTVAGLSLQGVIDKHFAEDGHARFSLHP